MGKGTKTPLAGATCETCGDSIGIGEEVEHPRQCADCEVDEWREEMVEKLCTACNGSGVGRYGPVETSRCTVCGGSGEVRYVDDA